MKKTIPVLRVSLFVVALLLASCSTKINFDEVETGQQYVGFVQGKNCVVVIDQFEDGIAKGRVYWDDSLFAVHNQFISELKKNGKGKLYLNDSETAIILRSVSLLDGLLQGKVNNTPFVLKLSESLDKMPFHADYKEAQYDCFEQDSIVYAQKVNGYWKDYPVTDDADENDYGSIYINRVPKLLMTEDLDLDLDLYRPVIKRNHSSLPLLVLIHGGAFYNGDKRSIGFPEMGKYFAQRGYVVASINYRLGFWPWNQSVDRAGYKAVQDANAAIRYLLNRKDELNIDPNNIYVAGSSAGAITALNVAFMNEDYRPAASFGVMGEDFRQILFNSLNLVENAKQLVLKWIDKGLDFVRNALKAIGINLPDGQYRILRYLQNTDITGLPKALGIDFNLGKINAVKIKGDNTDEISFKVKGVVNMWGAVHDLNMLGTSPNTSILSFHGTDDHVVPYGFGYPFDRKLDEFSESILEAVSFNNDAIYDFIVAMMPDNKALNELAFRPMYGSKEIDDFVRGHFMRRSELHTVEGGGHSLHCDSFDYEGEKLSPYFYDTILPVMTRFLNEEIVGGKTVRLEQTGRWFEASNTNNVEELHWQVVGGAIISYHGENKVEVLFFDDAPNHSVTVGGLYKNGVEFRESIEVNKNCGSIM